MDEGRGTPYAEQLGERLRNVRQQQGLSLHEVESSSQGQLKASVVGAYERGERAISVSRLRTLADFYRVPITLLIPEPEAPRPERGRGRGLRIDLTQLTPDEPDLIVVDRYLRSIQARRGDYNGRVLTMRGADLQALAAVLDTVPDDLRDRLVDAGIASSSPA
ncbi:MAG: transcriptional regulator [Actinobacteria bacterium]|nr:transcriptional regulator [Actinomycetota bacterium]